jgi:RNA polymerase sigma-70 factor (ECF subfamily)
MAPRQSPARTRLMQTGADGNVTALLRAWQQGQPGAAERLAPVVYEDLRRLARQQLRREGHAPTLRPTELVHETYLRLLGQAGTFENRAHFFALAATLMRRILVDRARRRQAARRGGGDLHVSLDGIEPAVAATSVDVIALDRALDELATFDPRQARVVELHFFGGLSFEDTADVLGTSEATVYREWRVARLWLLKRLSGERQSAQPQQG